MSLTGFKMQKFLGFREKCLSVRRRRCILLTACARTLIKLVAGFRRYAYGAPGIACDVRLDVSRFDRYKLHNDVYIGEARYLYSLIITCLLYTSDAADE